MAEVAPAGGGGGINRTFLLIVGGLGALLVIGILAVGALVFFSPKAASTAQATITPTRVAIQPTASPTKAVTATLVVAVAPTDTPVPATATSAPPTATLVVQAVATSTNKGGQAEATPAVTAGDTLPEGGLGENLLLLAGGMVLVVILFAARRARVSN